MLKLCQNSHTCSSNIHIEQIVDSNPDKLVLIDFHYKDPDHKDTIDEVWKMIGHDKTLIDDILLIDVNADLKYIFKNVMYDLNIYTQPDIM